MNLKMLTLTAACTLVLSACGNNNASPNGPAPAGTAPAPAVTASMAPMTPTPAMTANSAGMPAMATSAPAAAGANGKPAAVVNNCSTEIEATDSIQYSVSSITIPSSCTDFKITLKHTGNLPVNAMGHDLVITKKSDMEAVDQAGAAAGLDNGYVKPNDPRVIAHTKLIGGGETTSISFPVSKIKGDGPYVFFCSFPGHSVLMHGPISVE